VLFGLLVERFVAQGPLVLGVDETLERRRGKKIVAKGIYRDPVRSSHSHFAKTSALRWVCVTLLAEIPWASRVWALPFLCSLAPSERYVTERGKGHKPLTERAWQLLLLVRRWQPERQIVAVADSTYYASLKLLDRCRKLADPIIFITRLRLDAALYEAAPLRYPGQIGRPRLKGERLANLSAVAEDPPPPRRPSRWTTGTVKVSAPWRWFPGGALVQHGFARRAVALGLDPQPTRRVRNPGPSMDRPRCGAQADHLLVRKTLADGDHFRGSSPALGLRDAEAVVRAGDPQDRSSTIRAVFVGHAVCSPAHGKGRR
jgi:hypothetical protein